MRKIWVERRRLWLGRKHPTPSDLERAKELFSFTSIWLPKTKGSFNSPKLQDLCDIFSTNFPNTLKENEDILSNLRGRLSTGYPGTCSSFATCGFFVEPCVFIFELHEIGKKARYARRNILFSMIFIHMMHVLNN